MITKSKVDVITAENLTEKVHNKMKKNRYSIMSTLELTSIALPGIVFFILFKYIPMYGIILAFKEFRIDLGIWGSKWIGLANFKFFFESTSAWIVTRNTILYNIVFIIVGNVSAIAVAILLHYIGNKMKTVYKTTILLPYFISWVIVDVILYTFLDTKNGLLNHLLQGLGVAPHSWYSEAIFWPFIIVFFAVWKSIGFNALVYYAGILGIDLTYYEAAEIDGATRLQQVTKITIPLLKPIVTMLLILSLGSILSSDFGLFYFLPRQSFFLYDVTDTIDTYIFRALRTDGSVGRPAAIGLYQSLVGFVLIMVTNKIVQKLDTDSSLF